MGIRDAEDDKEEIKPFLLLRGQLKKFFASQEHLVLQCQSLRPRETREPSNRASSKGK